MKRTITINRTGRYFYRGVERGYITIHSRVQWNLKKGTYRITVAEGGKYRFKLNKPSFAWYDIYENDNFFDRLCCDLFDELFFKPDGRKKYNITVKKL